MHCFYLAKSDGVGYRNRLKAIWDTRNPSKTAISVNTLRCHARNIQLSNMLSEFELSNIAASCTNKTSCAGDVTNLSNSQGNDSIVEPAVDCSPIKCVEPSLPDVPEKVNCSEFMDSSVVCVIKFPEDNVSHISLLGCLPKGLQLHVCRELPFLNQLKILLTM